MTVWVNIPRSLSQVRGTIYTSTEYNCIKTTVNHVDSWTKVSVNNQRGRSTVRYLSEFVLNKV